MTAVLTPAEDLARALSRMIAAAPAADPWAKYPPVLYTSHVAEILGSTETAGVARLDGTEDRPGAGSRGHAMGTPRAVARAGWHPAGHPETRSA